MRSAESECGISTLEAAGIVLVMLPVFLTAISLINYMYEITLVRSLVDEYAASLDKRTMHIQTGEQDYFLRANKAQLRQFVMDAVREISSDVNELYQDGSYLAEVGYAAYQVSPQSGHIKGLANLSTGGSGHDDALIVMQGGNQSSQAFLENSLRSIYNDGNGQREVIGDRTLGSIFARPSGLKGARAQVHYGASHVFGEAVRRGTTDTYKLRYPHSNYYRTAVVVGVAVSVDLTETFTGRMLDTIGIDPRIKDYRISSPAQDF